MAPCVIDLPPPGSPRTYALRLSSATCLPLVSIQINNMSFLVHGEPLGPRRRAAFKKWRLFTLHMILGGSTWAVIFLFRILHGVNVGVLSSSHSGNSCWRKLLCHSFFGLSSFCLTSQNPFLDVFTLLRCSSKCPSALQVLHMYFFPNKWRHDMPFNFYFNSTSRDAAFCIKHILLYESINVA